MKPTSAQMDRDLAAAGITKPAGSKRAPKLAATPKMTGDTRIEVSSPTDSGYLTTYILRPATTRTDYRSNSGGDTFVMNAKRSQGEWLVLSRNGTYLGALCEGSGREPWCTQELAGGSTAAIPKDGIRLSASLRCAETWQEAMRRARWNI